MAVARAIVLACIARILGDGVKDNKSKCGDLGPDRPPRHTKAHHSHFPQFGSKLQQHQRSPPVGSDAQNFKTQDNKERKNRCHHRMEGLPRLRGKANGSRFDMSSASAKKAS